jgi:hypothetical protein
LLSVRRLAGTAVLSMAATALSLPFAAPASAVVLPDRVWTIVDSNGDDSFGLYYSAGPGGAKTAVEPESDIRNVSSLAASADGSRIIYMRYTYLPSIDDVKQEVVVRDTGTQQVRVLESSLVGTGVYPDVPALSPDGSRAVWESYSDATDTYSVRKALVGSGSASTLTSGDLTPYAFLTGDTVLVQTPDGTPYTIPFAGGSTTAVTGLPADAINVTVSPDGSKLAWGLLTNDSAPYTSTLQVATLTGPSSVGAATPLDTTLYTRQPAFSRDGSTLFYLKTSGAVGGSGDLWSVPVTGGPGAAVAATGADESDVAVTNNPAADAVAPAAPTIGSSFTIAGTSATVRWTLPADADLSGVLISRAGRDPFFVAAPNTAAIDTGLALGQKYDYTIKAVDRSGNQSVASGTHSMVAMSPVATFGSPTSAASTTTSFPVRFATGGTTGTVFDVDYMPYGGTWHDWVTGATGNLRTFGSAATTNVAATSSLAGGTYTFKVTVQDDGFGNTSAATPSAAAVVPWDQTKAVFSGSSLLGSSAAYLGSFRRFSSTAAYAKVTLVGNRLQVVGWKCSSCGAFAIYDGATKIGTVNTYAASLAPRVTLFTRTYASNGTHTFTIRPLGTAGHPGVVLDGFAMRRS